MDSETLARTLRRLARRIHMATLGGSPSPYAVSLRERICSPQPGDLVAEVTTSGLGGPHVNAVGVLERIAQDPINYGSEGWDETAEGRPHPTERVYYITTLDGREMRWRDAEFLALPSESV